MNGLIRILTAATLTVHLMVGCCAHHAHACGSQVHSPLAQGTATPDGQCPSSSDSGADHANHGPHDCQGSKCSFVSSSSPDSNSFSQPFQASVTLLLDDQHPLVGTGSEQHFSATGWLLLPVRLHLANQVMLI